MNNIEQMVKAQSLLYSNLDKLESIITAIESVLSPTMGEGNTVVAPEEEKAPKRWWEDYTWGEKDVGSLVSVDKDDRPRVVSDVSEHDLTLDNDEWEHEYFDFTPYTDDIKLHFKPWVAEEGKVPEDLAKNFAVLLDTGNIVILGRNDTELKEWFKPAVDKYDNEVVGYCNLTFVNPILGE